MKKYTQILTLLVLTALSTSSALGEFPTQTAKMREVMVQENKAMLLSHLRGNPDPRSVTVYNELVDKKPLTSAKLD